MVCCGVLKTSEGKGSVPPQTVQWAPVPLLIQPKGNHKPVLRSNNLLEYSQSLGKPFTFSHRDSIKDLTQGQQGDRCSGIK